MQDYFRHLVPHFQVAEALSNALLRLVLAAFLGGAIGLERELSHKPAGLRTNMFICFGAAMFTILSQEMVDPSVGDRSRIAANIITGIGFIGAGSILHSRGSVQGLTTAATLFVVASIGMAAGAGFGLLAIFATIFILLALKLLGSFEKRFNLKPLHMTYEAAGEKVDDMVAEINRIMEQDHRVVESLQIGRSNAGGLVHFSLEATHKEHRSLLNKLKESGIFKQIAFIGERE